MSSTPDEIVQLPTVHQCQHCHSDLQEVAVTTVEQLTHYHVHSSREHEALDDIGILSHFAGTSVHDAWKAYFSMDAIIACVVCISCMS